MKDKQNTEAGGGQNSSAVLTILQAEKLAAPPPELAPLVDALGVTEAHAQKLLDAAKKDAEFKDMTSEDLAVRLAQDPAGRDRLERAVSQEEGKPKTPDAGGSVASGDSGGPVGATASAGTGVPEDAPNSLTDWNAHPQDRRVRSPATDKKLTDWGV